MQAAVYEEISDRGHDALDAEMRGFNEAAAAAANIADALAGQARPHRATWQIHRRQGLSIAPRG